MEEKEKLIAWISHQILVEWLCHMHVIRLSSQNYWWFTNTNTWSTESVLHLNTIEAYVENLTKELSEA